MDADIRTDTTQYRAVGDADMDKEADIDDDALSYRSFLDRDMDESMKSDAVRYSSVEERLRIEALISPRYDYALRDQVVLGNGGLVNKTWVDDQQSISPSQSFSTTTSDRSSALRYAFVPTLDFSSLNPNSNTNSNNCTSTARSDDPRLNLTDYSARTGSVGLEGSRSVDRGSEEEWYLIKGLTGNDCTSIAGKSQSRIAGEQDDVESPRGVDFFATDGEEDCLSLGKSQDSEMHRALQAAVWTPEIARNRSCSSPATPSSSPSDSCSSELCDRSNGYFNPLHSLDGGNYGVPVVPPPHVGPEAWMCPHPAHPYGASPYAETAVPPPVGPHPVPEYHYIGGPYPQLSCPTNAPVYTQGYNWAPPQLMYGPVAHGGAEDNSFLGYGQSNFFPHPVAFHG